MKTPQQIVEVMMQRDLFSLWMGLRVVALEAGYCHLECETHAEMLNGFDILHGGITYSLSDSALAFASNSHGYKCVSIETSIAHLLPVKVNEKLKVLATEIHRGKSLGIYEVSIHNEQQELVSKFKGTVSISTEKW